MSAPPEPDEEDFRALLARNAAALARLARHYEAQPEARRDLEQEILFALWRARSSFRGECTERTWVYRIAHNVAATHIAKSIRSRRDSESATPPPAPSSPRLPDAIAEERNELRWLEERVRALDLPTRQLVLLALEGCTTAEIAAVTGLSPTNVTTRLSRIRKQLSEEAKT